MKFNLDPMLTVLAVASAALVFSFWYAHKSQLVSFSAFDLIMVDGKVDRIAFAFMLVLAVSTWVVVDLQMKSKMTEGYFGLFISAWIVPLVAKMVFGKNDVAGMTTVTATSTVTKTETPP